MSILKIKDSKGNWVGIPSIKGDKGDKGDTGNGISSAILNDDYTLTLTFTDGTTYKTPSIRGEKGEKGEPATDMEIHICSITEYDNETRVPIIVNPNSSTFYLVPTEDGTSPDLFTEWVYVNGAWEMFGSAKIDLSGYLTDVTVNGTSVVSNGVAEIPIASSSKAGAVKVGTALSNGLYINDNGELLLYPAPTSVIKRGTDNKMPITAKNEYASTFYGLAEASGDTTQSQSSNPVGTYTDEAKASIKNMLGIEDNMVVTVTGTGQIRPIDKSLSEIISALEKGSNVVVDDNDAIYPYVGTTLINGALVYAFGISVLYDNINVLNGYLIGSDGEADFAMPVNQQTTIPQLNDVQINGTSIVQDGVANVPVASDSAFGVVKPGNGLQTSNGVMVPVKATSARVKAGTSVYYPIVPMNQHESTFYGLAKSAGDTTQSQSSNAVGQYTDNAKDSIQNMLGITPLIASHETDPFESNHVVGELFIINGKLYRAKIALTAGEYVNEGTNVEAVNVAGVLNSKVSDVQINDTSIVENKVAKIPLANANTLGLMRVGYGLAYDNTDNRTNISFSSVNAIKDGLNGVSVLSPARQHLSTFYGLAKAAGDTTQSSSSNTVGTYTESAKSAISDMLNGAIQISGTDPTIIAKSGIRYICGEVLSLNFTPSANGICDVMFTSGSTPTVLTLPNTVKMPEWFIIEANTIYEINIADGIYGAVTSWTL